MARPGPMLACMPELPEVERVRRTLEAALVGRRIVTVQVNRRDVIDGPNDGPSLLVGSRIARISRKGKQLAIESEQGGVLVGHLGMTGQFLVGTPAPLAALSHVHVTWTLEPTITLAFRDPRRFGGLWPLSSPAALHERWGRLGPDALGVTAEQLREALRGGRRACKAVLLDQQAIAGVGNIYADEALFQAGISPRLRADRLTIDETARLAAALRAILASSVEAGGSTLRDFVDAQGNPGAYRDRHQVYGRAGEACVRCGMALRSGVVAQRTTVWCAGCQSRQRSGAG